MESEEDAPADNGAANCPICNKSVPLDIINSHIDVCLLPGGQSLPSENKRKEKQSKTESSIITTMPHSSKKRPSPSTKGKQSLLSFTTASSLLHLSPKSEGDPPPAKMRKMTGTPTSSQQFSEVPRTIHKVPATPPPTNLPTPLAEAMRPSSIEGYVGQESVIGRNAILRSILETGQVPSLIFWGPPGCGKTTLARIVAMVAKDKCGCRFVQLSATTSGVNEVKEVVKVAKNEKAFRRNTILFVDEIHRFNKLQQDTFLPHVEDGTITLLGATTENPSFQLNSALLSRCRVIVLEKLEVGDVGVLLRRAARQMGVELNDEGSGANGPVLIEEAALTTLAELCDGDARSALNGLQLAVQAKQALLTRNQSPSTSSLEEHSSSVNSKPTSSAESTPTCSSSELNTNSNSSKNKDTINTPPIIVTVQDVKESLQRSHLIYDRAGDEHYNIISALHKSMRGGDTNASLYWLARMLCGGEDPLYVARRIVRFASEDIGLADPNALTQAVAAFQGCQFLGMPECEVLLAQAVVYMAQAPKSIQVYSAYSKAKQCVKDTKGPLPSVPLHLRNAPTRLTKSLGYGRGYKYNPDFEGENVDQDYMPKGMHKLNFFMK